MAAVEDETPRENRTENVYRKPVRKGRVAQKTPRVNHTYVI